jgi:hypothetical protein
MSIPWGSKPRLIGQHGSVIQDIVRRSGAKIRITDTRVESGHEVVVRGTAQEINAAKELINMTIRRDSAADDASSTTSVATSAFTVLATGHCGERMGEREVTLRQLQHAKKHGQRYQLENADGSPNGRVKFVVRDEETNEVVTYITDPTERIGITTWKMNFDVHTPHPNAVHAGGSLQRPSQTPRQPCLFDSMRLPMSRQALSPADQHLCMSRPVDLPDFFTPGCVLQVKGHWESGERFSLQLRWRSHVLLIVVVDRFVTRVFAVPQLLIAVIALCSFLKCFLLFFIAATGVSF